MSKNNTNVEDVSGTSQYDGELVLRDSHSLPGHYLRTRESLTLVQAYFDTFEVEYVDNLPKSVEYFAGTKAHLTTIAVRGDNSGDLAGTYFLISGGRKDTRYAVWYSVDGSGTAPGIPNTIELEVSISQNDPASIVAYATQLVLRSLGKVFKVSRTNAVLEIETVKLGITNNTLDNGTGFTITNESGEREKVDTVRLNYSASGFPIWQGQELRQHKYNIYTARFELEASVQTSGGSTEVKAKDFTVQEVNLPAANTSVTVNIPDNTKKFLLQAKNPASIIKVIDNSTNNSFTIRYGSSIGFDGLNTFDVSFKIESNKDNNIIELLLWQ